MKTSFHYRSCLALYASTLVLWQTHSQAYYAIPSNGPLAGGNLVILTNVSPNIGNGSDITNLTVQGEYAQIADQGTSWVAFITPPRGTSGVVDVFIQSTSVGNVTLTNAYTYNPAGQIGRRVTDWSQWQEVSGLSTPSKSLAAATLDGSIVALGGYGSSTIGYQTNVAVLTDIGWMNVAGLPDKRSALATGVAGGALYAIGGFDYQCCWTELFKTNVSRYSNGVWTNVPGLPAPRLRLGAGSLAGVLYAVGGEVSYAAQTNVYAFDGASWIEVEGLPAPRSYLAAGVLYNSLLAIGGYNGGAQSSVFSFDGESWTSLEPLPSARANAAAAVLDDALYLIGGYDSGFTTRTNVFRFNGTNWSEVVGLPVPRQNLAAASDREAVYAIGGEASNGSPSGTTNVFRYPTIIVESGVSPSSGSWTGGYPIIISGVNIGNGADITNVTVCGVPASILVQNTTQVVVSAGVASAPGHGSVSVFSTAFGVTTKSNAFEYIGPVMGISGTLDFGKVRIGQSGSLAFAITNTGNQSLTITNIAYPPTFAGPYAAIVAPNRATNVVVTFTPLALQDYGGTIVIFSDYAGGTNMIACSGRGAPTLPTTWHVATNGNDLSAGTNWPTAKATIQAAIDEALQGDTVLVSNGVYASGARVVSDGSPSRIAVDKAVTVRSVNGAPETMIVGQGPVGPGAVRCAFVADGAVLQGFTLTGGATWNTGNTFSARSGGALNCTSTGGVIRECIIVSNMAHYGGGAHREGTLYDCQLLNNSTVSADGGASYYGVLVRCRVERNQAGPDGLGGGLYRSTAYSCLIAHNTNNSIGGGAFASSLFNCTVVGNASTGSVTTGGGISGGTSINCIVVGNYSASGDHNFNTNNLFGGLAKLVTSCTFPMPPLGSDNITNDPQFVDYQSFRVTLGSPCIDRGTNQYWMLGSGDLDGKPRVVNATVDIGAYEYSWDGNGDMDNDGIPDNWEISHGLNPAISNALSSNSDSDWMSDYDEYIADTNPTNSASRFPDVAVATQGVGLVMFVIDPTSTSRLYGVLETTNLLSNPQLWLLRTPERTGTGAALIFSVTNDANESVYRTRVRIP